MERVKVCRQSRDKTSLRHVIAEVDRTGKAQRIRTPVTLNSNSVEARGTFLH